MQIYNFFLKLTNIQVRNVNKTGLFNIYTLLYKSVVNRVNIRNTNSQFNKEGNTETKKALHEGVLF